MKKWIMFCLVFVALSANAGSFGGGRSGGGGFSGGGRSSSFSSGARSSSFGGSRSSGSPATISRPAARSYSAPSAPVVNHTTVVNQGGGGGGGFLNGYLWGHALSQPAPVIVQPVQGVVDVGVGNVAVASAPGQVVVVQQHGFLFYAFWWLLGIAAVVAVLAWAAEVFE